jgi:ubiquinone/menaquinone biosynthesis C-methylase UbiE
MSTVALKTGDLYKDEVQRQWDRDPCGSQYGEDASHGSLQWFLNIEQHRYGYYAPWMPTLMEFSGHPGERVLEVGAGLGTDLAQFARNGSIVTDLDMSAGHLELAKLNFARRGLTGAFHHGDAENMPFDDATFDVVYSNGVIHHTPNTSRVIGEIRRVLKPGGRAIIMVYAEHSLNYWRNVVYHFGLRQGWLDDYSVGEIMSRTVEISEHGSRPLVKVYTKAKLREMFAGFEDFRVAKRQLVPEERSWYLSWIPTDLLQRLVGWNLIVKARRPR